MRYKLTTKEEIIIKKAKELLYKKFDCKTPQRLQYFIFENDEDVDLSEYQICEDDKCLKQARKELNQLKKKGEYPFNEKSKGWITHKYSHNFFDHENIEYCSICEKPLNNYLTWIRNEFRYFYEEYDVEIGKSDIDIIKKVINSDYFYLYVIFNSMPSCDFQRDENYDREKELFQDVVKWANFIVKNY